MKNKFWKDKKVLITGHTGFKSRWLSALLELFGAAAKASTFINLFNIHKFDIKKIIDNAKSKQGKFIAGTKIQVVHPKNVDISKYDFIFIFAWNLKKEILKFIKNYYSKKNVCVVTFIPRIKIVKFK